MLPLLLSMVNFPSASIDRPSRARYPATMRHAVPAFVLAVLLTAFVIDPTCATLAEPAQDSPAPVPTEDYPIYDLIVDEKFLTPETKLVLLERTTVTRLHPEQQRPLSLETFREYEIFDGRLPLELVRDFVFKNRISSKLGGHFGFGVHYRFIAADGTDQETSLAPIPAMWTDVSPIQEEPLDEPPTIIDRLAFSRVAYTFGREQALVYVEYNRVDGTGAGFAVWLTYSGKHWGIFDSELVWAARPQGP
jgi:hypothetical protein